MPKASGMVSTLVTLVKERAEPEEVSAEKSSAMGSDEGAMIDGMIDGRGVVRLVVHQQSTVQPYRLYGFRSTYLLVLGGDK